MKGYKQKLLIIKLEQFSYVSYIRIFFFFISTPGQVDFSFFNRLKRRYNSNWKSLNSYLTTSKKMKINKNIIKKKKGFKDEKEQTYHTSRLGLSYLLMAHICQGTQFCDLDPLIRLGWNLIGTGASDCTTEQCPRNY